MVIYLKKLEFSEVTGAISENGYCAFQAVLFSKNMDEYTFVVEIDTIMSNSGLDVTNGMMRKGSKMVEDFITKNLNNKPIEEEKYSYDQILQLDNIRKQKLKLYNAEVLIDGIYLTYNDFKNQTPNANISNVELTKNGNKILKAYYLNKSGKEVKLEKNKYYGAVYKGAPFIYLKIEDYFVKAKKRENDFYFEAKANNPNVSNTSSIVFAGAMFGVVGSLLTAAATSSGSATYYDMKLDYINGKSIILRPSE